MLSNNCINKLTRIFFCGDVMTGRGIDQLYRISCNPVLYESYVKDARIYVSLGEQINGHVVKPISYDYIWGTVVPLINSYTDYRIINFETSVTTHPNPWPMKGINYRMHPENIRVLNAVGIDCVSLANNHILDWNYEGFYETLRLFRENSIKVCGVGMNIQEATAPAVIEKNGKHKLYVYGVAGPDCGVPSEWAATETNPGVHLLSDYSDDSISKLIDSINQQSKSPDDITFLSIHLGSNWGYHISKSHIKIAHDLIDHGVIDVFHGHSSHHLRKTEIYKGKIIMYGCGDFINDYEGIQGHEEFHPELVYAYLVTAANNNLNTNDKPLSSIIGSDETCEGDDLVDTNNQKKLILEKFPFKLKNFKLENVTESKANWLDESTNN